MSGNQQRARARTPLSVNEPDTHETFTEMLNEFGRLQIDGPQPGIVQLRTVPRYPPGLGFPDEEHMVCQNDEDIELPCWEVYHESRDEGLFRIQAAGQHSQMAVVNTTRVDNETRRLTVQEAFSQVAVTIESEEEALQDAELDFPDSDESDESDGASPMENQSCKTESQSHESLQENETPEESSRTPHLPYMPGSVLAIYKKLDGSRFIVTEMHGLTGFDPGALSSSVNLSFGFFDIKELKIILSNKLTNGVPMDRLTFSIHDNFDHSSMMRGGCFPTRREGAERKMTPEDWHRVLMCCKDDDWADYDRLWTDFLPTVSSEFF